MPGRRIIATALAAAAVVLALGAFTASASDPMVFDRGLPTTNLNNVSGANRSNVAWSNGNTYVSGDDFAIGASGETWIVSGIRAWTVVGGRLPGTFKIGDVLGHDGGALLFMARASSLRTVRCDRAPPCGF